MNILFLGIGGALGSVLRYSIGQSLSTHWLSGTVLVNLTGAFLMGILMALLLEGKVSWVWGLYLGAGFLGGFTTFSAFSYEAFSLLKQDQFLTAFYYVVGSVIGGILSTYLGWLIVNKYK